MADFKNINLIVGQAQDGCAALMITGAEWQAVEDTGGVVIHLGTYSREGLLSAKSAMNEVFDQAINDVFGNPN